MTEQVKWQKDVYIFFPCKCGSKSCIPVNFILQLGGGSTVLSHQLFTGDLPSLFICPPQCSLHFHFQSANQSPVQFTSDFNLASIAMLILAASCSSGQMQTKKRVERQRQRGTAALLVSLNLSKVLCQVFPVQPCIPFTSLKV